MKGRRTVLAIASGGCLAATVLAGCSAETRQKILPVFFDGVSQEEQKPPPPTRRVRRDLLREIEELRRQLAEAREAAKAQKEGAGTPPEETRPLAEREKTWTEAAAKLPKDAAGHVDWVQALRAGAVAPRPGLDPKTPDQATLDLDVPLASSSSRLFWVTFSHGAHTQWVTCGNCHPAVFPLKRQAEPTAVTMAKITESRYCGVCHGKVAFGLEGRCARCHTKIPATADWRPSGKPSKPIEGAATWTEAAKLLPPTLGSPDWVKALQQGVIAPRPGIDPKAEDEAVFPLDVELVPPDAPAFKVVFPHEAHTTLLSCTTCHPGIFQMARGADPITMEKIYAGEYCGRCHGKVAFSIPTGCPRCHPVLAGS